MLFPQDNESRQVKDLDGLWRFKVDENDEGFEQRWYARPLQGEVHRMPVPASYNDVTPNAKIRQHVGKVWYERDFTLPHFWSDARIVVRVGAACHHGTVWVNGEKVAYHKGGYLPFEADITEVIARGGPNRMTIAVDNMLDWTTLPPGELRRFDDPNYPKGHKVLRQFHDNFNYAGLHRSVRLLALPHDHIADISVSTEVNGADGAVSYQLELIGTHSCIRVRLLDEDGKAVGEEQKNSVGKWQVEKARLWEPGQPYLYTLLVQSMAENGDLVDTYRLPVGIRSIEVTDKQFLINGKPFYFKGFGKHEDAELRGKGFDEVTNARDFSLLKWIGANSFRTAHNPVAEEVLNLADREGVVIIAESPATGMIFSFNEDEPIFTDERISDKTLEHHLQMMREMIARDKNHPCVVMWTVANEPSTQEPNAEKYFKQVFDLTRELDSTRPVSFAAAIDVDRCRVMSMADVVCVNRYYAWYEDCGQLDLVDFQAERELRRIHEVAKKPVLMTEFGAEAIPGLHHEPPVMFSEEFQHELLKRYHRAFDKLDFLVGEHMWTFSDFMTPQGVLRVHGNRKGAFDRDRQPKMVAHLLRKRWGATDTGQRPKAVD